MASHAVVRLKVPQGGWSKTNRLSLRYLLKMSLRQQLVASLGSFNMDNIASYPERHDGQFPGKTKLPSQRVSPKAKALCLWHSPL